MHIDINLNNIEGGFELIPEGKYICSIHESTKVKVDDNEERYIFWIAKIVEGDYEGKFLSWRSYYRSDRAWVMANTLKALGIEWSETGFELDDCIGLELGVVNKPQEWPEGSGEYRNNIVANKFFSLKSSKTKVKSKIKKNDLPF